MQRDWREAVGRQIDKVPYFILVADADGNPVVPMTEDSGTPLALERSPALEKELLCLVGGSPELGRPMEDTANRELQVEPGLRGAPIDFLGERRPFKPLTPSPVRPPGPRSVPR
ncbi:MAG: hypothetical protein R6X31_09850 [Anaerolineae bacterium]